METFARDNVFAGSLQTYTKQYKEINDKESIDAEFLATNLLKNNLKLDEAQLNTLLNSKLYEFYFKAFIIPETKTFPKIRITQLQEVPIPLFDFQKQNDKKFHDKILLHTKQSIDLYVRLQIVTAPTDKDHLNRRIKYTQTEMNTSIYAFYNLTQNEIDLIESI